jgi:hypothetical protein
MTDIRTLLHDAAAAPVEPLDMRPVLARARPRSRRWLVWLASLSAVGAIGAPVGLQWANSGDHAQVRTLPAPQLFGTTTTTPGTAQNVSADGGGSGPGAASSLGADGLPTPAESPAPAGGAVPAQSSADECVLIGRFAPSGGIGVTGGPAPPAGAGFGNAPSQSCDYDATHAAGYVTSGGGNWELDVHHPDGTRVIYSPPTANNWQACQPVGIVRPGDHVHATLADGVTGPGDYLKVGPTYHC